MTMTEFCFGDCKRFVSTLVHLFQGPTEICVCHLVPHVRDPHSQPRLKSIVYHACVRRHLSCEAVPTQGRVECVHASLLQLLAK